jgi:hypothetical protein
VDALNGQDRAKRRTIYCWYGTPDDPQRRYDELAGDDLVLTGQDDLLG